MGLLRFAGDIWNQGVEGIKSSLQGKVVKTPALAKDIVSDAAEAFIPVDLDRWGGRGNKLTHYSS